MRAGPAGGDPAPRATRKAQSDGLGLSSAVAVGFEPTVTCATLAFEVCSRWSGGCSGSFNPVRSRFLTRRVNGCGRYRTGLNETETETECSPADLRVCTWKCQRSVSSRAAITMAGSPSYNKCGSSVAGGMKRLRYRWRSLSAK